MKNHYSTLNVPETADQETIRLSYRRLLRQWHPDRNPDKHAAAITQRLTTAYRILSNDFERRVYDQQLASERGQLTAMPPNRRRNARPPSRKVGTHDTPRFHGARLRMPAGLLNKQPWQTLLAALRRIGRARG